MKSFYFTVTIPLTVAYKLDGEAISQLDPDTLEKFKQALRAVMRGRITTEVNSTLEGFDKAFDIRWDKFKESIDDKATNKRASELPRESLQPSGQRDNDTKIPGRFGSSDDPAPSG